MKKKIPIIKKILETVMLLAMPIAVMFICIFLIRYSFNRNEIEPEYILAGNKTSEEIHFACRYHGIINTRFCDESDEYYFYRNGQRCRLFTADVISAMEKIGITNKTEKE